VHKIIVDTNVIVSSLISDSFPRKIIREHVLGRLVTLVLSESILNEYKNVLSRGKFIRYPNFVANAEILLLNIEQLGIVYPVDFQLDIIADKPDNEFLALAMVTDAKYLITGNSNDFTFKTLGKTRIVNPKEYCELEMAGNS